MVAAGMAVIAVCYGLARFAYGLFVPVLRAEFELSGAVAGLVAAGLYVGYCVAIVTAMLATPWAGARVVAVAAAVTATVGMTLIALAPGAAVLAVGAVVAGSSTGLASPPLAAAVAALVRADRVDRAQSVVNAGTGVGVVVAGPVALLAAGQWRAAWLAFAALALLVGGWVARAVPSGVTPDRFGAVRRAPGAGQLFAGAAVMGVASAAMWTFGKDLLVAAGWSERATIVVWVVLGAAGLLGALSGELVARAGLGRTWLAAMVGLGGATAAVALAPAAAVVGTAAAVFGAAYIVLTALVLLRATYVFTVTPATGVGAAFLVLAAGQAAGAPLVGWLVDRIGGTGAFLVAAAVALVGALLWLGPAESAGRVASDGLASARAAGRGS